MSIPDHEIEVGPWPDFYPEEEPVRSCANCIHYSAQGSSLLDFQTERHPCAFPMPQYITHFFQIGGNMLPTDGKFCAVHKLEGEP